MINSESLKEFIKDDKNAKLLLELLNKEDLNVIKNSIKNEVDVNAKQSFGGTALHLAAYKLDIPAIEFFMSKGAEVDAVDEHGRTSLHYVFFNDQESNSKEVAEMLLLKFGADVNSRDNHGNSALHHATKRGFVNVIKLLLSNDANVNLKGKGDYIPLISAIRNKNIDLVRLLVSHGSDLSSADLSAPTTPLMWALHSDFDIFKYLLEKGADVNSANYYGETALHHASQYNKSELFEFLIEHPSINVNAKNSSKETPLSRAILRWNYDIAKKLVDRGADVNNVVLDKNRTPLCLACKMKNLEMIEYLLENGADPNDVDGDGFTPLMNILNRGFGFNDKTLLLVELLLQFDANVNLLAPCGRNVLSIDPYYKNCSFIIMQHVAILQDLDTHVNPTIMETIKSDGTFDWYFTDCKRELIKAKNARLRNCWVSFFNILTDDVSKVVKYAGNQDLIEDFEITDLTDKFPLYGCAMKKRMSNGIRIRKSWDLAATVLSEVLTIFNPTHLVVRDILDCLEEQSLLKLLCT